MAKYATGRSRSSNLVSSRHETLGSLAAQIGEVVYAVRCKDGTIKIGWSSHLQSRVNRIGGGLSAIIGLTPGGYDEEQAIHATLIDHRAHGREYYHATPEVLAVVNDMRARFGLSLLSE